jgi:mRNA-degrading endonuclease RelE of RelBE toxin-antitoxin system
VGSDAAEDLSVSVPPYRLSHVPVAEREFLRLPLRAQLDFEEAYIRLVFHPRGGDPMIDVRQVRRRPGLWRLAVGTYRAFYRVEGNLIRIAGYLPRSSSTCADLRRF